MTPPRCLNCPRAVKPHLVTSCKSKQNDERPPLPVYDLAGDVSSQYNKHFISERSPSCHTEGPLCERAPVFPADSSAWRPLLPLFALHANDARCQRRITSAVRAQLEPCGFDGRSVHIIKTPANEEQAAASVGAAG